MLARFLCVVPILIVPTTLMGSTLPLLTRHFVSQRSDAETASRNVGILYALNTFGAATGPVLSAFVLLPTVGLSITNIIACSMNFSLAVLIFALREPLIGSKWGSGVKLEIFPGKANLDERGEPESAATPIAATPTSEQATTEAARTSEPPAKKSKKAKKAARVAAATEGETANEPAETESDAPKRPTESSDWVPPIARRMAFVCFAASGMAALCSEVVWSRALAMCNGSSIYGFSLTLEAFLIGIASGAAAMSAFLGKDTKPGAMNRPLVGVAITAFVLTLLANTPWAVDFHIGEETHPGSLFTWFALSLLPAILLLATYMYAQRLQAASQVLDSGATADITAPGLVMILVPLTWAGGNLAYFHDGYFPKIVASLVAAVSIFTASMLVLRRSPVLMLAVMQLYIGLATVVSYIWQDEVPYAFAQLVVGLGEGQLPSHVGTVQFFMLVTAILCTLPATLGMGAMFPLTVRLWTSGGQGIAKDVSVVYTGNTFGSIVGSWLPGFVLMPAIGMERTLHAGIVLNLLLALLMLIAGAAEPDKDAAPSRVMPLRVARMIFGGVAAVATVAPILVGYLYHGDSAARLNAVLGTVALGLFVVGVTALLLQDARTHVSAPPPKGAGELPMWHAVTVYVLSPLIPALLALLWLGTSRPDSILRWNQTQMTLGVFRVSLAEGMLDPQSWGQPDLVYYHDGLSTTVTVERWGRHYALKNNGKVDASNGDDMPTQITVSAYPMLMHSQGPENLDVAVIGFGSGVTVGTTLSFPVHSVDVIELERSIPEAARFFEDVNLLDYQLDHFPFVQMDRLTVINDDGRNFLASTENQYDVIISEPSNPWITGVSDLFTIDHFRIAKRRLRPGGVYCQWVQLYEMSPENIKTIFRTFAEVYRYVVVFAADDRSSDTVVLGSDAPLTFDLTRLQHVWQLPAVEGRMSVPDQLERAYLHTPYDVFARVLLASRDEVMTYTQIEERRHGDTWEEDYASTNTRTCDPENCRRRPAEINTDDNARIEFGAPRDLIGFERYEGYLTTVYSAEWPFGRVADSIENFGEGDERARNLAELAMSLIGHGRYEVAADFIEQSQHAGRARETAVALEILTHLLTNEHEPAIRIEAPVCGPEMDHDTCELLQVGFEEVRAAVDRGQYGAALQAMEEIPSPLRLHSGPAMRFLYGYLLFKAAEGSFSQYRAAAETLEDLTRTEETFCTTHPEVHYFLSRSYDNEGEYGTALTEMRRYIEARLTTSHSDMVDTPEPPDGEAPTTDEPGESDKTTHDD
jgi:predicted membrane-bound spermidine synthase